MPLFRCYQDTVHRTFVIELSDEALVKRALSPRAAQPTAWELAPRTEFHRILRQRPGGFWCVRGLHGRAFGGSGRHIPPAQHLVPLELSRDRGSVSSEGGIPTASEQYPVSAATFAILVLPPASSPEAICMRHLARYCIGGVPTRSAKRSASTERDTPTSLARSSIVRPGLACISDKALPTKGSRKPTSHPAFSGGRASRCRRITSMNISSLSLASTLSPPARLSANSIIATRLSWPSQPASLPCGSQALMIGGKLSSSGLNGWASQAR